MTSVASGSSLRYTKWGRPDCTLSALPVPLSDACGPSSICATHTHTHRERWHTHVAHVFYSHAYTPSGNPTTYPNPSGSPTTYAPSGTPTKNAPYGSPTTYALSGNPNRKAHVLVTPTPAPTPTAKRTFWCSIRMVCDALSRSSQLIDSSFISASDSASCCLSESNSSSDTPAPSRPPPPT